MKATFALASFCWIFAGTVAAQPPASAGADGPVEGTEAAAAPHWAYEPIREYDSPKVENQQWVRNPVDNFVLAKLEARGVAPSPEADRYTLVRRLYYDLIGLPPTPAEVDAFVEDRSPDAYERLVDRLLRSPHFGERWGRHWLDKARYADSDGYEKDRPRPDAWRYRDWVIDVINRDLPFDQFTRQQLAGDLLPPPSPPLTKGSPGGGERLAASVPPKGGELHGEELQQNLATAFHRQTLTNTEGGVDQEQFRVEAVFDRVETTGTVWLGLTVGCARCHDHKYDQITQKEYFRLFAFFNNGDETTMSLPPSEEALAKYENEKAAHERRLKELQAKRDAAASDARGELDRQIAELKKKAPKPPVVQARVITERTKNPRKTHIFRRGEFLQPQEEVQPGTLAVLQPFEPRGRAGTPDRLDLADWLVDPRNPLTPRVAVNHVWAHLFGRGIVPTMNDFGVRGERPTHLELLDWLAARFASPPSASHDDPAGLPSSRQPSTAPQPSLGGCGWSRKALIKLIVMSATYRQSSHHRSELAETDPQNSLFHRQNRFRVEAEIVRDLHLAVSGLLSRKLGGPSVFPSMPPDVAALSYANNFKWNTSDGPDRYRRGMYTFFKRTAPHPNLTTFDCPDSNVTCVERRASNTPLMALTTLNNITFVESAQALASRIASEPDLKDDAARLTRAVRLCVARPPSERELAGYGELLDTARRWYKDHPSDAKKLVGNHTPDGLPVEESAAWVATVRVMLNMDEFITRE